MKNQEQALLQLMEKTREFWAVNGERGTVNSRQWGGEGGRGGPTCSRTARRLSASVLQSSGCHRCDGTPPQAAGSRGTQGRAGMGGAAASAQCAPGPQRARLKLPCTAPAHTGQAGGRWAGLLLEKAVFQASICPLDLEENHLVDDSKVLYSTNPWTGVRALTARLWGAAGGGRTPR